MLVIYLLIELYIEMHPGRRNKLENEDTRKSVKYGQKAYFKLLLVESNDFPIG